MRGGSCYRKQPTYVLHRIPPGSGTASASGPRARGLPENAVDMQHRLRAEPTAALDPPPLESSRVPRLDVLGTQFGQVDTARQAGRQLAPHGPAVLKKRLWRQVGSGVALQPTLQVFAQGYPARRRIDAYVPLMQQLHQERLSLSLRALQGAPDLSSFACRRGIRPRSMTTSQEPFPRLRMWLCTQHLPTKRSTARSLADKELCFFFDPALQTLLRYQDASP